MHTQFVDVKHMSRIPNFGQHLSFVCPRILFNKMPMNSHCTQNEEKATESLAATITVDKEISFFANRVKLKSAF